jgi:hypothetical protein
MKIKNTQNAKIILFPGSFFAKFLSTYLKKIGFSIKCENKINNDYMIFYTLAEKLLNPHTNKILFNIIKKERIILYFFNPTIKN